MFASLRFDTTYSVPSYRRWLDSAGHLDAYRFHRRFLQHLQHQSGSAGRWVLKCPDHVFAFDAIRSVYPDARVVFVHRDPLRVLLSAARLTEVLRRPFTRHIDRAALGRQECERWSVGAELMIDAADREPFAEPIFHIRHRDLVGDPLGTIKNLYRHFGLTLDAAAAARIERLVASSPNGGYGTNHYRFDTFEHRSRRGARAFRPLPDPVRHQSRTGRQTVRMVSGSDPAAQPLRGERSIRAYPGRLHAVRQDRSTLIGRRETGPLSQGAGRRC